MVKKEVCLHLANTLIVSHTGSSLTYVTETGSAIIQHSQDDQQITCVTSHNHSAHREIRDQESDPMQRL